MNRLLLLFFLVFSNSLWAQTDSLEQELPPEPPKQISVRGKAYTDLNTVVSDLFVVNKRTSEGSFGDAGGNFNIKAFKSDTLIFGALGMSTKYVSFNDSVPRERYDLKLVMRKLSIELAEAEVIAPRELVAIEKDLRQLGFDDRDYRVSGVDAFESPITFLYQAFSKVEKSKRRVAELENMEQRRDLLKELFQKYVEYDIIDLSNDDFDDFIDFIGVNDAYLRSVSQYDFIQLVKQRYEVFKQREKQMKDSDFNYDQD